jgi:REP element-mobilizing transposase RayT
MIYGKRKSRRSLSFKNSTHFILRLKQHLPPLIEPRDHDLRKCLFKIAHKYNIKIYRLVFNHSHLHGVLLLPSRESYVRFVRETTSFIVRHLNSTIGIFGVVFRKIFCDKPFTRSVAWGRAYRILMSYMDKNEEESGTSQKLFDQDLRKSIKTQMTLFDFYSNSLSNGIN